MNKKHWWKSLTIWGTGILTFCAVLLPIFGKADLATALQAEQGNIVDLLAVIGSAIGTIMAIYGRIRAAAKITK